MNILRINGSSYYIEIHFSEASELLYLYASSFDDSVKWKPASGFYNPVFWEVKGIRGYESSVQRTTVSKRHILDFLAGIQKSIPPELNFFQAVLNQLEADEDRTIILAEKDIEEIKRNYPLETREYSDD